MQVTILCDNRAGSKPGLIGEHGFSALVESEEGSVLFDTGQGIGLLSNAFILDKELEEVDTLVLSHAHWDHTGGIKSFLTTGNKKIYAHPDLFIPRFTVGKDEKVRSIGISLDMEECRKLGGTLAAARAPIFVMPNVQTTGEIDRGDAEPPTADLFRQTTPGMMAPDPFTDDISLILHTPKGIVLLLGCAHAELTHILNQTSKITGCETIHAVIGGTHLGFSGEEEFADAVEALKQYQVEMIVATHCTGGPASGKLAAIFGEGLVFGEVGKSFDFS